MNWKSLILISWVWIAATPALWAQQDPMYTHYMYNTQVVNPAYAGSRDALTVTGLARLQWVGFDGSPSTKTLTVHGPILGNNFGFGVALSNDAIAKTKVANTQFDFAYRLHLSRSLCLAMGLKGSLTRFTENLDDVKVPLPNDPLFIGGRGRLLPNVGAGLYIQHDRFYAGLSVPQLLENQLLTGLVSGSLSRLRQRHYYGIMGAVFELKNRLKLKPTLLVKYAEEAPLQVDLTATLIMRDKFSAGLMYRLGDALGMLLGFNVTEQLQVGYSFDWSVANRTARYNGGSHEFMLRYDFLFRNSKGARSPRYF